MWRRFAIAAAETLSDTEVWEYSLPRSGILSGVLLHIENTNGGTDNVFNPIYKNISKVQVVDGGRILHDVTGVQAELLSLMNSGAEPRSKIREAAGDTQTFQSLMLFGRHLYDDEMGLDLSKLRNPKLRVDIDFTQVRAVGATGFLSGSGTMSGLVFINDGEGAPSPNRFVKSHEIKRWTSASSGDELTQGPVDGPWRRLIIRAHVAGSCPDDILTDLKLSFDSGQFVAIDEKTKWQSHAFPLMFGRYPRMEFTLFRQNAETIDLEHGSIQGYTCHAIEADEICNLTSIGCGNVVTAFYDASGSTGSTQDQNRTVQVWPAHPYMSMVYDFLGMGELGAETFERADIALTQAVAAAACSIVLEQSMENVTVGG